MTDAHDNETAAARDEALARSEKAGAKPARAKAATRSDKTGARPARTTPSTTTPDRGAAARSGPQRTGAASGASGKKAPARKAGPTGALAAGAARASGERQRRSGTPLISATEPLEVSQARRALARVGAAETGSATPATLRKPGRPARRGPGKGRTETPSGIADVRSLRPVREGREARREDRPESAAAPDPVIEARPEARPSTSWTEAIPRAGHLVEAVLGATESSSALSLDPAELVGLAVNVLRAAAAAAGLPAEEVEQQVAHGLAYVRRRLSGSYAVDEFGFDRDFTTSLYLPLLRPLYKKWFRVEVRGVENIPATGGALLVANHSGTVALDSIMTQVAVHDEHPQHRHLRMLGADLVFKTPFVGTVARRTGSTLAANTDAERLLTGGELVGVWPEGFKGVGKPFTERYKLQRFGRGGFVAAALRTGVPIIPCSIVGAEEIYPIIGNVPSVARLLGMPYAPITPTFPLLGLLGLIPLPSKWFIEFGTPIETAHFGPESADDPMLVFDLTDQVRETIQQTLYSLLMQRKSVFF